MYKNKNKTIYMSVYTTQSDFRSSFITTISTGSFEKAISYLHSKLASRLHATKGRIVSLRCAKTTCQRRIRICRQFILMQVGSVCKVMKSSRAAPKESGVSQSSFPQKVGPFVHRLCAPVCVRERNRI